ncbi:MAG: TIGR04282 family arsenosugar biosynthesis glycosyltransferase [Bacillota bacterium]
MRLIIFTRYPEAGKVKTRLIPALGEKGAELLHREMVTHTIALIATFNGEVEVHFAGGSYDLMKNWLGKQLRYRRQQGTSLGERLYNAAATAFAENKKKVIIIGTDCPGLTANHVEQAFHLLDSSDLVLGPADDGGYYLVGFKKIVKELFHGITWGSNLVYRQTIKAAEQADLKIATLEKLADIDSPTDLPLLAAFKNNFSAELFKQKGNG